jgi:hypothetical protein
MGITITKLVKNIVYIKEDIEHLKELFIIKLVFKIESFLLQISIDKLFFGLLWVPTVLGARKKKLGFCSSNCDKKCYS